MTYGRSKITFFRSLDALGGTYKGTHEAKLFGMQSGSVLSGLEAENVTKDLKKPGSG